MASKRNFTHIIFDMDGLLIDTERIYTEIMQRIASKYGKEFTWEIKVQLMGTPSGKSSQMAVEKMELPISAEEFMNQAKSHKKELFPHCNIMPGAEALVRHLHNHNVPIALASGSITADFETKTTHHKDFFTLFQHRVLGDDPKVKHGKPNPDVFLAAASRFPDNPDPSKVLVFEDAPNGVKAAKAAGMGCVMVPDQRMDSGFYNGADAVLLSLEEFKPEQWGFPSYDN